MVAADPLAELVGFLHDKNPQVRAVAAQELVPYSTRGNPKISIFKSDSFRPITDLRILVLDEPKTAHDSLTILINLSQDVLIRSKLVDEIFLNQLLAIIINTEHGLSDLACMLLSNLAKSDAITLLFDITRTSSLIDCPSSAALNQLLDVYVRGSTKSLNPHANYDFLTNLFSDLTRFSRGRTFFLTPQEYDSLSPLSKIIVFTDSSSRIRRTGVSSIIKNCCFDASAHEMLLDESGLNLLLSILTPLCGPDSGQFRDDEVDGMFDALQFLPDDKKREEDAFTVTLLLDALLLLCSTKLGRDHLRRRQTYAIVRDLHMVYTEAEGESEKEVVEACDKLVNILMREDHPDVEDVDPLHANAREEEESDEELMITEV